MKRVIAMLAGAAHLLVFTPLLQAGPQPGADAREIPVLTFGASVRFRYEFQNNFNQKYYGDEPGRGSSNDGYLLGRFQAGFDWYPTDRIHVALWGQHADSWDCALPDSAYYQGVFRTVHHSNKDRWELYTSYIELKGFFDTGLAIKAGRQTFSYGDSRVFGPSEWGNSGRWIWDAVKLSRVFRRGFVDAYYGRTVIHQVNRFSLNHRHGYESLGFYGHIDLWRRPVRLFVEPMFFTQDDRHRRYTGGKKAFHRKPDGTRVTYKKEGDLDSWYGGARLHAAVKGCELGATFLREQGRYARDDLAAFGYHVMIAYTFPAPWKPRLSVEYSYASGDKNPDDGELETFQGAFGACDKMYGRMNLFQWRNLKDLEANIQIKPRAWLQLKAEVHQFQLAERRDAWYLNQKAYRDPSGRSGDDVGKEFDLVATCSLPRGNTLAAGFGHFWPDRFAKKIASNKQANWFFFQWEYAFNHPLL